MIYVPKVKFSGWSEIRYRIKIPDGGRTVMKVKRAPELISQDESSSPSPVRHFSAFSSASGSASGSLYADNCSPETGGLQPLTLHDSHRPLTHGILTESETRIHTNQIKENSIYIFPKNYISQLLKFSRYGHSISVSVCGTSFIMFILSDVS
jgi:hypothetical protein